MRERGKEKKYSEYKTSHLCSMNHSVSRVCLSRSWQAVLSTRLRFSLFWMAWKSPSNLLYTRAENVNSIEKG